MKVASLCCYAGASAVVISNVHRVSYHLASLLRLPITLQVGKVIACWDNLHDVSNSYWLRHEAEAITNVGLRQNTLPCF